MPRSRVSEQHNGLLTVPKQLWPAEKFSSE